MTNEPIAAPTQPSSRPPPGTDIHINIQTGCEHRCRYCYAEEISISNGRSTVLTWPTPQLRLKDVQKGRGKCQGRIMFPSSHDITPRNLDPCIQVLLKSLARKNDMLIITKAYLPCMQRICRDLQPYRDQIIILVTIGSTDDAVLRYWEPGAPSLAERMAALQHSYEQGFMTGVSCEPILDANVDALIASVRPYVSNYIRIGTATRLLDRVRTNCPGDKETFDRALELNTLWNASAVRNLYARYQHDPVVLWCDSIKEVVGG